MSMKQIVACTLSLGLSLCLTGCAADLEEESVGNAEQEMHAWGNYHWARTSNPFTIQLGDNVSAGWDGYLATASSDWSQSNVLDTSIVAGQSTKQCRPTAGRVEVCNSTYGNTGWLGIAQIWLSGGHISQGAVKLNDTYFNTATYNTPAWRNLVMCQEVGHTFGLGHNDEDFNTTNGTCMDYSNDPVPNQHPDNHDYQQLSDTYAHVDNTTTVGLVAPVALGLADQTTPDQWGEHIGSSPSGNTHHFERDFGEFKIVTSVTWAPEP